MRGWEQTLRDAGAEVPPVLPADWSAASGYRVGQTIARIPEVTAVFAANDHLALGILRALHEHGKRVPEDLSLVGFDDVPEAGYFIPPLTTVRPDFHAVARHALELLLAQIEAGVPSTAQMMLPPTLIERRSVSAPPSRLRTGKFPRRPLTDELLSLTFSAMPPLVVGVDFGTLSGRAVVVRVHDGAELGSAVTRLPARRARAGAARRHPAAARVGAAGARRLRRGAAHRGARRAGRRRGRTRPTSSASAPTSPRARWCRPPPTAPRCASCRSSPAEPHAYVKLWKHHAAQRRPTGSTRSPASAAEPWLPRYGGLISSEWEFAKGLQVLEEAPEVYAAMEHWVEAADWIVWQLTGTYVRNACTAGYKGIHQDGAYPSRGVPAPRSTPAFARLRRPTSWSTRSGASATARAGCPPQAAAWTGLPEGIAVRGRQRRRARHRARRRTPSSPACSSRSWAPPPATS